MAANGQLLLTGMLHRLPLWGSWTQSGLRGLLYFTTFSPKIQKISERLLTS